MVTFGEFMDGAFEVLLPEFEVLGFKPDEHFSFEALELMQRHLRKRLANEEAMLFRQIIVYGLYFGHTLGKNIEGAKWEEFGSNDLLYDLYNLTMTFPEMAKGRQVKIYPVRRVEKWVFNDQHTLTSVYKILDFLSTHDRNNKEEMKPFMSVEGYVKLSGGEIFKIKKDKNEIHK